MNTTNFKLKMSRAGLLLKKYSPEIMLGVGSFGMLAAMISVGVATTKVEPLFDEAKEDITDVRERKNELEEKEYKKELTKVYLKTTGQLIRVYLPSASIAMASYALIFGSYGILNRRNAGLMAAYAAVDRSFSKYRERVKEEYGEEKETEIRYGLKKEKVDVEYVDEKTGKTKKKKEDVIVADTNDILKYSPYAKFFNESNPNWERSNGYNLLFLRNAQNYLNDKLRTQGHLFLNEAYDLLGFPRTQEGAIVGWVFDLDNPARDNYVDIGLYDLGLESNQDFINGYEKAVLLDFNVDGVIYDLI